MPCSPGHAAHRAGGGGARRAALGLTAIADDFERCIGAGGGRRGDAETDGRLRRDDRGLARGDVVYEAPAAGLMPFDDDLCTRSCCRRAFSSRFAAPVRATRKEAWCKI